MLSQPSKQTSEQLGNTLELLVGQVLKLLQEHTGSVWTVAISSDGGKIVSGSGDKTVRIWSTETGQVPACLSA